MEWTGIVKLLLGFSYGVGETNCSQGSSLYVELCESFMLAYI